MAEKDRIDPRSVMTSIAMDLQKDGVGSEVAYRMLMRVANICVELERAYLEGAATEIYLRYYERKG